MCGASAVGSWWILHARSVRTPPGIIKLINIRENCIFKSNSLMPSQSLPRLVQRPTPHSVRRVTFPECSVHLHQGGQIFHGIGDKPNNSLKYQFFSFDFYFSPPGLGTGLSQNLNVTVHVCQFCTGISKKIPNSKLPSYMGRITFFRENQESKTAEIAKWLSQ